MSLVVRVRSLSVHTHLPALVTGLLAVAPAASAAPQIWSEQVGTTAFDTLRGVTDDGSGGTFECGVTSDDIGAPFSGDTDAFLTRRQADGSVLWTRTVATALRDEGITVAPDGAGGVFLAGHVRGVLDASFTDNYDAFVARFDSAGNQLWLKGLGIADYEQVSSCASDGAGGVFVAGQSFADPTAAVFQNGDLWLTRIDAAGNTLWLEQFGSSEADIIRRVESDGAGGALLCGSTFGDLGGPLFGTFDGWAARYDAAGNLQHLIQFSSAITTNLPTGIAPDGAGGTFIGYSSASWAVVARYDAGWNLVWQYAIAANASIGDLVSDGAGGAWVLGTTPGEFLATNVGNFDVWIRRIDANGITQQALQFGSQGFELGAELTAFGSGVVAAGYSWGPGGLFGPPTNSYKGFVARFEDCDFETAATYCNALPNSTGEASRIGHLGSKRIDNNDFTLFAKDCPVFETGVFLAATAPASLPFGNGNLCVGGSVHRLGAASTLGGFASLPLDFNDPSSPASQIAPGSTWYFQYWYRDLAGGGAGFNLSNGLSVTFCP